MKDDFYRLSRVSEVGHQLLEAIESKGITAETLQNDLTTQWLVTTPLYNIGEQVNCISRETTEEHPDIPWSQIAGLRHRLVHDYEGTNWSIIASIVFDELETFIEQVDEILTDGESSTIENQ